MIRKKLIEIKVWSQNLSRFIQYLPHRDAQIIFANSFPKSGTNLFTQILRGFAESNYYHLDRRGIILTYQGASGKKRPENEIIQDLKGLYPGEIGWGHIHATPGIQDLVLNDSFIHFFVFRDPRDVVVSHAHYVSDPNQNHVHFDYYQNQLDSIEERITTSILGIPESGLDFPDIAKRFEPYLPWVQNPRIMKIKFEELIHQQDQTLQAVLDHLENSGFSSRQSRSHIIEKMKAAIDPVASRTFRKGTTGDWKNHFTEAHIELFKDVAGDLLLELGYEDGDQW